MGLDPGQVNVAATVVKRSNEETLFSSYSNRHHRELSGISGANRKSGKNNQKDVMVEYRKASLAAPFATTDLVVCECRNALFSATDNEGISLEDRLWAEKMRPNHRRSKFRVYRLTKQTLARYVRSLGEQGRGQLIILYGDGSWAGTKGNAM